MNKIITIALAILCIASAPASAAPDRVAQAQQIARDRWGNVCNGQTIPVGRGLPGNDPATARGYYSFDGAQPDNGRLYHNCFVMFRRGSIPWPEFCTAMVHEYGHLAGWRPAPGTAFKTASGLDTFHSGNPNSVMYPFYQRPWSKC